MALFNKTKWLILGIFALGGVPNIAGAELTPKTKIAVVDPTGAIAFDPEGRVIAVARNDGKVSLIFVEDREERTALEAHQGAVHALAFSRDGNMLYTGGDDGRITAWDPATATRRWELVAHEGPVRGLAISKFGDLLISSGLDGRVQTIDLATNSIRNTYPDSMPLGEVMLSSDGRYVLAAAVTSKLVANERTVRVIDLEKQNLGRTLVEPKSTALSVALAETNNLSGVGYEDGRVAVFELTNTDRFDLISGHSGPVNSVSFHKDGRFLASAGEDRTLRIWDTHTLREIDRATANAPLRGVQFDAHGVLLAAVTDKQLLFYDTTRVLKNVTTPAHVEKFGRARALFAENKTAEAKALVEEALVVDARFAKARSFLGRLFLDAGEIEKTIAAFEQTAKDDPGDPTANIVLGIIAREKGEPDNAITFWQRALTTNPNNAEPHMMIAQTEMKRGRYAMAGKHNLAALDLIPGDSTLMYNLAATYAVGQQATRSLDWLESALKRGHRGYDWIDTDPDLANIRGAPRYREIMVKYGKSEEFFRTGGRNARADEIKAQADAARKADKDAEAMALYKSTIAEERAAEKPRIDELRMYHFWLATLQESNGDFELARDSWEESLALARQLSLSDNVLRFTLTFLGKVYLRLGDKQKALEYYEQAANEHRKKAENDLYATNVRRAAEVLVELGRFDDAQKKFDQSMELAKGLSAEDSQRIKLEVAEATAGLYEKWGQPKKALEKGKEVLAIARTLPDKDQLAGRLLSVGDLYNKVGETKFAQDSFRESITIAEQIGQPRRISLAYSHYARFLNDRGKKEEALVAADNALDWARRSSKDTSVLAAISANAKIRSSAGKGEESIKLFEEGLTLARKIAREDTIASLLSLTGNAYREMGQLDRSKQYLEESLALQRKLGALPSVADALFKVAHVLHDQEKWEESSRRLSEAVQIYETLRKRTSGDARREFLASQISAYRFLTLVQLRADKVFDAYRTIELSRAKMLAEHLASNATEISIPTIPELQNLAGDGAILTYGNSDWGAIAAFTIDRDGILPRVRNLKEMITKGTAEFGSAMVASLDKPASGHRGITRKGDARPPPGDHQLADLVHHYRWLLANPSTGNSESLRRLGKLFYEHLIKPMEPRLEGKKDLLIVPDGALALIPFETFIDDKGRYLGDVFNVRYVQSLSVLRLIERRKYGSGRKPLLAFGGAIYESPKDAVTDQSDVRRRYASLGYESWEPLPGTLAEVKSISQTVRGTEVITGAAVEEANIKEMSRVGKLAEYRVLHFATHGIVVPEATEMSALVLSQFGVPKNGEDGYLSMAEIGSLKLNADFVALSACETGLGRIYDGEGLVGLSQAFLVAGANALSVSLWQVADESTAKLMGEVYRLVETKGLDWGTALAEVKREFSRGTYGAEWKSPHYWAPFVYYGGN